MPRFHSPATFRDAAALAAKLREWGPDLGCDETLQGAKGPLGQEKEVLGRTLKNRFAIHPMEGWDGGGDGMPTAATLRRWHRFGLSSASLIWGGEAFAVCPEARANPNQLHQGSHPDVGQGLAQLLAALRAGRQEARLDEEFLCGLQLTHSGRWACPTPNTPTPRIAFRHPLLDAKVGVESDVPVLTDEELADIPALYVQAALLAQEAGFDFVDIKCCHGYLLHEFLAAHSRPGPYGSSFAGRTRLFREIVAAIRQACPALGLGVRFSVTDLFPYVKGEDGVGVPDAMDAHLPYEHGFGLDPQHPMQADFTEPFQFLDLLQELDISLVNLTASSPYSCPHISRPAAFPPSDGYFPPEDPLAAVALHLNAARHCKAAYPDLVFVGTGYSYLQEWLPHVAQHEVGLGHVDFVGLGRMVLAYPEMPRDVLAGHDLQKKRICRTFSDCTTAPRNGMASGCWPLDPGYREQPESAIIRDLRPRLP